MGYQIGHLINGPSGNTYATIEAAEAALDQLVNATWQEEAHALREILESCADRYDRPAGTENHNQHRFAQMVEAGEDMEAAARACVRASHRAVVTGMATIERRA
ncbi:hypothetical protein [uncultured Alcanivorax sp.]|jgi:hypothetical protein|uniref:hypothetical protein n=1 Tax=uncultured Alcanivorax sp. TaxID=191215 RepID=UPI0025881681|nr:hypothetical protein [uncultured Alcanivorax sp.]